ncbi:hypothetical protein ACFLSW_04775 [Candidatus Bipolaricaulota bacterium]
MTTAEATDILAAAQRLFSLTDAELERLAAEPEQLLAIMDMLTASQ